MPEVSVIIPTYNRGNILEAAIASVLDQTYVDFELIVVDDGSTDNTRELVEEISNQRTRKIKYIFKENGGEASARNRGLAEATGEFIAFLDSDDFWLPNHLEIAVAALRRDASLAAVFTDHGITKDGKEIVRTTAAASASQAEMLRRLALRDFVIASDAIVVRRSIYEECSNFNESLEVGTDWEMWMRIAARHKIGYLPQMTVVVRQHNANTSASPKKIEEHGMQAIDLVIGHCGPNIDRFRKKMVAKHLIDVAYFYSMLGNRRMAIRKLASALALNRKLYRDPVLAALLARIGLGRRGYEYLRNLKHYPVRGN